MWWDCSWRRAIAVATALFVFSSLMTALAAGGHTGVAHASAVPGSGTTVPGTKTSPFAHRAESEPVITNDSALALDNNRLLHGGESTSHDVQAPEVITRALAPPKTTA